MTKGSPIKLILSFMVPLLIDEYWIVNDLPFQKVNKDLMQAIKDQIEKSESLYRIKFKNYKHQFLSNLLMN